MASILDVTVLGHRGAGPYLMQQALWTLPEFYSELEGEKLMSGLQYPIRAEESKREQRRQSREAKLKLATRTAFSSKSWGSSF